MKAWTAHLRSRAALSRFFLTVLIGLSLDLWTKKVAFERLAYTAPQQYHDLEGRLRWTVQPRPDLYESRGYVVIPHWLNFNVTVNEGAVFGIGQGRRWAFVLISVAAIVFLTYLFAMSGKQRF